MPRLSPSASEAVAVHQQPAASAVEAPSPSAAAGPTPRLLAFIPVLTDPVARAKAVGEVVTRVASIIASPVDGAPLIAGFVLGCLGLGENPSDRLAAVRDVVARLPSEGVRIVTGVGAPLEVIDLVASGIDVVDSDYTSQLTSLGYAACFQYDASDNSSADGSSSNSDGSSSSSSSGSEEGAPLLGDRTKIPLRDKRYARDTRPLVPGCTCFSCSGAEPGAWAGLASGRPAGNEPGPHRPVTHTGHSRAYVHHLLSCHEMLGDTLLSVHNTAHYAHFMDAVRRAVQAGPQALAEYRAWFVKANAL